MLTLTLHSDTHIALRNCYAERDAIKALAPWPDVQWSSDARAWLIDVRLLDALYSVLGSAIAPASADFWMTLPLPQASTPRRRTKQQIMAEKARDKAAAGRFGAAIVEMKR